MEVADVEEQVWDWGRRQAGVGLSSRTQTPSPRGQSLEGQQREVLPVPLGAAAGLSTKVRLKRDMALVPQAAAAMRNEAPAPSFSSIDTSGAGRRPPRGRGELSFTPNDS